MIGGSGHDSVINGSLFGNDSNDRTERLFCRITSDRIVLSPKRCIGMVITDDSGDEIMQL